MAIIRVALDLPLPRLFDYQVDDAGLGDVGRCARVPFAGRELTGVIWEVAPCSDVPLDRLKPARAILRDVPPLPEEWRELVSFCSQYYHVPLGQVTALALPPDLRRAALSRPPRGALQWFVLTALGREGLGQLRRGSAARRVAEMLGGQAAPVCLVPEGAPEPSPAGALAVAASSDALRRALNELAGRGWIARAEPPRDGRAMVGPPLVPEQAEALAALCAGLGSFRAFLLHGVTGSGKTEVYLRLIEQVLADGRQALMLVPEIGLTPQQEGRVRRRFPGARIVSLHSGLGPAERSRAFLEAMAGEADIVLGTRLSIFTPLPRLGVIVVDEEHDASFKQQDGVRYSARDLAIWRARQRGVPIVLGSATPSYESFFHAHGGRYTLLEMRQRAVADALPTVRCVDTRDLKLDNGVSEHLFAAIEARLARGEQSLVFLNRRGYAPVLACPWCGWVSQCRHCAANMVVHLAEQSLRCHHCSAHAPIPRTCPVCGNVDIHAFGRGTQRVEETLQTRFPQARVLRVDRDSARTHRQSEAMLEAIRKGEADILVGTQMLAKGHDFPRLTLVGILGGDASLHAADFRAPERLFAQLMQVGGRAGRADLPGEVLIQTQFPDHPLYQALTAHDYNRFAEQQLGERRDAGFPPFAFQSVLRAEAPELEMAETWLKAAAALAREVEPEGVQIYDPVPMRMARRANVERAQLLVESARRPALQAFLGRWLHRLYAGRAPRELRWHLDVDPLEL